MPDPGPPDPTDALYPLHLLSVLRSGDAASIHKILETIGRRDPRSPLSPSLGAGSKLSLGAEKPKDDDVDLGAQALHLGVRCASLETLQLLLTHRSIPINTPYNGITPLALAAQLNRADVLALLYSQPDIDDTIKSNGKSVKEMARERKSRDCLRVINEYHAGLRRRYEELLRAYILSAPTNSDSGIGDELVRLIESPAKAHLPLSALDLDTGQSVLHAAALKRDLRMLNAALRSGADPLVRDRSGKLPSEVGGKGKEGEEVRVFLRGVMKPKVAAPMSSEKSSAEDVPGLKGYLNKYTNVARGYNVRWFVLKGGVLSYYKTAQDESVASRGSISMRTAVIKTSTTSSSEGGGSTRWEILSVSSGAGKPAQKWYLKANHPVEAQRWIGMLEKSVEWSRRAAGAGSGHASTPSQSSTTAADAGSTSSQVDLLRSSTSGAGTKKRGYRSSYGGSTLVAGGETSDADSMSGLSGAEGRIPRRTGTVKTVTGLRDEPEDDDGDELEGWSEDELDDVDGGAELGLDREDGEDDESAWKVPFDEDDAYKLLGNGLEAQIEALSSTSSTGLPSSTTTTTLTPFLDATREFVDMTRKRERYFLAKLHRERERRKAWEEAVRSVVKEGEEMEKALKERSIGRGGGTVRAAAVPKKRSKLVEEGYFAAAEDVVTPTVEGKGTLRTAKPSPLPIPPVAQPAAGDGEGDDSEDEFFDAIESNTLPNLVVPPSLSSPPVTDPATSLPAIQSSEKALAHPAYKPYAHLRSELSLKADSRPNTSLWSVLKHSIGKDLTKISFPVFFNEPTSMLQRMAEDVEFVECLDTAAKSPDPLVRIMYVAAFAMSNYSSTIGRIAKPFNPMLSETFEYVRPDKGYRYVSEQVSHHPPISACWAESERGWRYYGEVDAQNKFMGKSFEIRPTGVAHAELLLPESFVPPDADATYPKATFGEFVNTGAEDDGKAVVEHYSWKKVTTNVSGFIMGSPTIDHYGDMILTNHRTRDTCILTFKPRGWRGKDAYEISGQVSDAEGNVHYEIAGRWNSQLIARRSSHSTGGGVLNPDQEIHTSGPASPSISNKEYLLLWRNSEKPTGSPFNLTPFALSLNDCPNPALKRYLPPTDCRLRPDQRAFELGRYERANELKTAQEEKQRATRKAREEGKTGAHRPRWFKPVTDGDTGERVWTPERTREGDGDREVVEYWVERERVWKAKSQEGDGEWKDVEGIFVEEPGL